METLIAMPEISHREEMISIYSDCHKDAYGFRPRGIDFSLMSDAEIDADIDRFCAIAAEDAKQEAIFAAKKVEEFKLLVKKTIALGAGDEETALRWLTQTEKFYHGQCVEHWVWNYGILFTDYGRALVKKLLDIVRYELPTEY